MVADERILVHVSNFRPVKRICDVIEIFDQAQKKIPSKAFADVGTGLSYPVPNGW